MKKIELLAPVGTYEKLLTACHFGADAVYLGGKSYGLRAYAGNFSLEEMLKAVNYAHSINKKVYVTVNVFAYNVDFVGLKDYVDALTTMGVDAIIVSDAGIIAYLRKYCPNMEIHLSTQANTLNKYAVEFWRDQGIKRVVLAREVSLDDIKEIKDYVGDTVELEAFVHGAMCIAYSGRCLLSTYLTDRNSNKGECVQACRWEYAVREVSRPNELNLAEDERGSYIFNSKDMNTLPFLDKIIDAGVTSLKIEGRMKSSYYVGSVVNAYRKRIDGIIKGLPYEENLNEELYKVNHREYTSGFYFGKAEQCYSTSMPDNDYRFCAEVLGYDYDKKALVVEQRNRFFIGDKLETVSVTNCKEITVNKMFDELGNEVPDAKFVRQKLYIPTDNVLAEKDMLRKKVK